MTLHAKVLTVSSSVAAGAREDGAGPRLAELLQAEGFEVLERRVATDGFEAVTNALAELCAGFTGLVVTTGGTGFSPDDVTPEATRALLEREAPGLAEAIRRASPLGPLSRGVAGTIGSALVVNVPGSVAGATESLEAVRGVLPHALELLAGDRPH